MSYEYEEQDVGIGVESTVSTMEEPDSVNYRSHNIKIWLDRSLLPRTLLTGTYGMRKAGGAFLPKHPLESDNSYSNRLSCSPLLNGYMKTTSFLSGQIFQTDMIFDESVDPRVIEWCEEIDGQRNAINVFAKRFFMEGLAKGVNHILIDAPVRPEEAKTKADDRKLGIRPYFRIVRPEDVLGALVDENGKVVQVRISETKQERVGRFGCKTVKIIRVLEPGKWETYEEDEDGSTTSVDSGTYPTQSIPLVTFIPGEEWTPVTGEAPMADLAELNGSHWRSNSHQSNILDVARVPILFGRKIELEKMPVGVATMIVSDDDNSDMKYVEHTGQAIAAGQVNLKELEAQMALYGLQQLVPRSGNMTATEKTLTAQESNSSLATWGLELQSVLQRAFEIACEIMGEEFPSNAIEVNTDFFLGIADPAMLASILKAHEQGILSAKACFDEFRRRSVFDEHLDWDDMEDDMEQEKRDAMNLMKLTSLGGDGEEGDDGEDTKE